MVCIYIQNYTNDCVRSGCQRDKNTSECCQCQCTAIGIRIQRHLVSAARDDIASHLSIGKHLGKYCLFSVFTHHTMTTTPQTQRIVCIDFTRSYLFNVCMCVNRALLNNNK